jgi:predicted Zn-dependent protease
MINIMKKIIILSIVCTVLFTCASNIKKEDLAREYYNIANAYYGMKKYADANQYYKRAIELDSTFSTGKYNYAQSLLKINEFDTACLILEDLSSQDSQNTLILTLLGYAYHSQKKDDKALATFEKILSLSPDNATALYNSGIILWKTGKMEDAQKRFERAISLAPDDLDVVFNLGNLFFDLGNYEKAISTLGRYLEKKTTDEKVFLLYARSYAKLNEYAPALEAYDQLLVINNRNKDAWFEKAEILLTKVKDPDKGLLALSQALDAGFADNERIALFYNSADLLEKDKVKKILEDKKLLPEPGKDQAAK